jgi:hypothetical protein
MDTSNTLEIATDVASGHAAGRMPEPHGGRRRIATWAPPLSRGEGREAERLSVGEHAVVVGDQDAEFGFDAVGGREVDGV